ncbi:hypothetical protein CBR_g40628 [Chara braunii]|uniref:Methyltransferase domain-containing protein n=1 Tax=Chara braunii TaxID=69332 RepID=A0A388LU15_CHABU|nr:hypothetical protein CBR_g40628 [Chara braunii]|eukprot:GBG85818.1 hypothetical protein CBR_g40628 [Chara braunii]
MFDWFTMRGSFQSSSSSLYPPRPAPHFPKDPLDFICVPKSPVPQPGRDDHTSVYSQLETASAIRNDNVQRQQFLMQGDPRNPAGALAFRQPHVMETWEPLYHCPFEERVGPYGDGGKWMCRVRDYTDPSCVIYSFGSFSDLRWERDVARLTQCSVHIYDPTPHVVDFMKVVHSETDATSTLNTVANTMSISALPRRTQYHPWAFYEPSNVLATTFLHKVFPNFTGGNLRWIVENTGSGVPQIIKMDVEGSELFIDFKADADLWTQVHMFLVEVHFSILTEWIQTGFYNLVRQLTNGLGTGLAAGLTAGLRADKGSGTWFDSWFNDWFESWSGSWFDGGKSERRRTVEREKRAKKNSRECLARFCCSGEFGPELNWE